MSHRQTGGKPSRNGDDAARFGESRNGTAPADGQPEKENSLRGINPIT
jgi:hypothetical protein